MPRLPVMDSSKDFNASMRSARTGATTIKFDCGVILVAHLSEFRLRGSPRNLHLNA